MTEYALILFGQIISSWHLICRVQENQKSKGPLETFSLIFPLWASWFKKIASLSLRLIMLEPSRNDPRSFTVFGVRHEMPSEGKTEWKFSSCVHPGESYRRYCISQTFLLAAGWPETQAEGYWPGRPCGYVQLPSDLVLWHNNVDVEKWGLQSENMPEGCCTYPWATCSIGCIGLCNHMVK